MDIPELNQLVKEALAVIEAHYPGERTQVLKSIESQLEFIKNDLESAQSGKLGAKSEDVNRIIIGIQAVREIEGNDDELAELLMRISYKYKKMHGVSEDD